MSNHGVNLKQLSIVQHLLEINQKKLLRREVIQGQFGGDTNCTDMSDVKIIDTPPCPSEQVSASAPAAPVPAPVPAAPVPAAPAPVPAPPPPVAPVPVAPAPVPAPYVQEQTAPIQNATLRQLELRLGPYGSVSEIEIYDKSNNKIDLSGEKSKVSLTPDGWANKGNCGEGENNFGSNCSIVNNNTNQLYCDIGNYPNSDDSNAFPWSLQ